MMAVPFVKATACGNDFLIIDGAHAPADMASFTRRICDRHHGVGADGVEWLFPDNEAISDVYARLFNADGSEAEISGNGTRCVAAHWASEHPGSAAVRIRTGAGVKDCRLVSNAGTHYEFETAMGKPQVDAERAVKVGNKDVVGVPVSTGNPHFVRIVDAFPVDWQAEAALIARDASFPNGVNVEYTRIASPSELEVRFFERGVGETQSSGTGSCAAAVAAIHQGLVQSPVLVQAPGGTQTVRWEGEIHLSGPAELLCRGEFFG
jgi:diaminopimelate epimerase